MTIKPGSKYRIEEKSDGKTARIVGPMKPYGCYGFFQCDRGFLYFQDKYFMRDCPERDLKGEVIYG